MMEEGWKEDAREDGRQTEICIRKIPKEEELRDSPAPAKISDEPEHCSMCRQTGLKTTELMTVA